MNDQKKNTRKPVWGPPIFMFGVLLFIAHLILVYNFRVTAGTLYLILRFGGLGFAIIGWVLWRLLKR